MDRQKISQTLSSCGIRPSIQRTEIYAYLVGRKNHPSADAIYSDLKKVLPGLSKMTVYNALNLFVQKGLAQPLAFDGAEARFDADASEHVHFKCQKCGEVFDIFGAKSPQIPDLPKGFLPLRTQVTVFGFCPACAENRP